MSLRVIVGALALLVGCQTTAVPMTFGPGLGHADDDDDDGGTGVMTSGITGAGEDGTGAGSDAATDGVDPPATGGGDSTSSGGDAGTTAGDDAGESTGASDGSSSTGDGIPGDPLDGDLDVPEDGDECDTPGSEAGCPFLEVCRFYSSEQNMCEGCDSCGNLGALCNEGTDCDILFVCFEHRCTNICELGTTECGPVDDCIDVGHPTHGACDPSAI